ncbi:MAG: phage major capsid protein [Acidobacteria bacterium]|nr:phage major capsid protein [Acidobacteriota bacterium]
MTAAIAADNVVSAAGAQANTGDSGDNGSNSIGSKDLTAVWHSLNPAYRMRAAWYLNADTLQALDGLLDKNGRPIVKYRDGLYTIYGRPIAICPSMDSIGPSKNPIVVADPNYFYQRRIAAGSYLRISWEVPGAVEFGMAAFQSWYRTDSRLSVPNASVPPIVLLQNAS